MGSHLESMCPQIPTPGPLLHIQPTADSDVASNQGGLQAGDIWTTDGNTG